MSILDTFRYTNLDNNALIGWPAVLGCTDCTEKNYLLQNVLGKNPFLEVYWEMYWDCFLVFEYYKFA